MYLCLKPLLTKARPTGTFAHAGQLNPHDDRQDPRLDSFNVKEVDIDLRECEFVLPAAALWCLVYLTLSAKKGSKCRLLVPLNMGVCVYLKTLGLFDALKAQGIDVDTRGVPEHRDAKVILPITPFHTTADATKVTNEATERLQSAGLGAINLTPVVAELFSELALNAVQHSESPIGAYGCIQFNEAAGIDKTANRFVCSVADGGIGVLATLERNPELKRRVNYDWDALELAVRERISGTGDPHRGIGLYGVSEDIRRPGGSLLLHSGMGSLQIKENLESSARRTRLFPGTLAHVSVPV